VLRVFDDLEPRRGAAIALARPLPPCWAAISPVRPPQIGQVALPSRARARSCARRPLASSHRRCRAAPPRCSAAVPPWPGPGRGNPGDLLLDWLDRLAAGPAMAAVIGVTARPSRRRSVSTTSAHGRKSRAPPSASAGGSAREGARSVGQLGRRQAGRGAPSKAPIGWLRELRHLGLGPRSAVEGAAAGRRTSTSWPSPTRSLPFQDAPPSRMVDGLGGGLCTLDQCRSPAPRCRAARSMPQPRKAPKLSSTVSAGGPPRSGRQRTARVSRQPVTVTGRPPGGVDV